MLALFLGDISGNYPQVSLNLAPSHLLHFSAPLPG